MFEVVLSLFLFTVFSVTYVNFRSAWMREENLGVHRKGEHKQRIEDAAFCYVIFSLVLYFTYRCFSDGADVLVQWTTVILFLVCSALANRWAITYEPST